MLKVIVRSKRDADAVKAMLRTFYDDWDIGVATLHGARSIENVLDELEKSIDPHLYNIVLLGREDSGMVHELEDKVDVNVVVHMVPRARIRNTRLEHLFHELEVARSKIRLNVRWVSNRRVYRLSHGDGERLEGYSYNPAYDSFLGIGEGFRTRLSELLGFNIGSNPLLIRMMGGKHLIYSGNILIGELEIPDEGVRPKAKTISDNIVDVDLEGLLSVNKEVLRVHESISLKLLEEYREWADTVIVPWSGGKDSTVALLLAVKAFGRDRVKAIYVDTGVEFPFTHKYVEELAEKLGIELHVSYARIDRELLRGAPMPTHDNRWCTRLKIETVSITLSRLREGRTLIVLGDRDAESEKRSRRPPIRVEDKELVTITPVKMWGTFHVQLYLLLNNIPLNPLYEYGFYRIGCYICPALRSWEVYVMLKDKSISEALRDKPLYKKFLDHRLSSQHQQPW